MTQNESSIIAKYPKYLTKYSLMDLQKSDSALRIVFCIQTLVLASTLAQPVLMEQKRDFKLSDEERALLGQVKESGAHIAKIVQL